MTDPRDLIKRLTEALDDRIDYEERMYPDQGYMPLLTEALIYLVKSATISENTSD